MAAKLRTGFAPAQQKEKLTRSARFQHSCEPACTGQPGRCQAAPCTNAPLSSLMPSEASLALTALTHKLLSPSSRLQPAWAEAMPPPAPGEEQPHAPARAGVRWVRSTGPLTAAFCTLSFFLSKVICFINTLVSQPMPWTVWILLCTAVLSSALWQEAAPSERGVSAWWGLGAGNPACACAGERNQTGGTEDAGW